MKQFVMALDAGTTSNRCILFDRQGNIRSVAQKDLRSISRNRAGWSTMRMRFGRPSLVWQWKP